MSSKLEKEHHLLPTDAGILHPGYSNAQRKKCLRKLPVIGALGLLLLGVTYLAKGGALQGLEVCSGMKDHLASLSGLASTNKEEACPQVDVLQPVKYGEVWQEVSKSIGKSEEFRQQVVDWLSGSVKVKTETFDGMGPVEEDPRWQAFVPFHEYLLGAFPQVHATLKLTKVNTFGLLYEWKGTDESLKPLMLAAHQDVVPVDQSTLDQWTHPPYSGYYDGEYIWGRGSSDDKSGLIGVLASVETLIKSGFKPTRTVVLAFGFDEEASGGQGAGTLAPAIEAIYGKDGIAMIIDEGAGFSYDYGSWIATPGIAEKGYINVQVTVQTSGGHSSVPPPHTSIGILSALLVHAENHPFKAELTHNEPFFATLQCIGAHAKSVPSSLRKAIHHASSHPKHLHKLSHLVLDDNTLLSSLVGNTQAIDLIQGGVKSNALPERAWAVINHRVNVLSSLDAMKKRDVELFKGLAGQFNLTFEAFGESVVGGKGRGSLVLGDYANSALEPAPITPTSGEEAEAYRVLSGSIKAAFGGYTRNSGEEERGEEIVVAPGMMTGNTDTRYYWNLSKNIFRYSHHNGGKGGNALANGIHTVNEHMKVDTFLEMIQFFTTLVLNVDEAKNLG